MTHQPYPGARPPAATTQDLWQAPTSPPGAPSRRRIPGWVIVIAAATAVLSVVTFVAVVLWPAGSDELPSSPPLVFHGLVQVPAIPYELSRTTLTSVLEDRVYAGWEQDGDLHLKSRDLVTGAERMLEPVSGADQWLTMAAVPGLILVLGEDSGEGQRVFVLDPDTGVTRWDQRVGADDHLFLQDETLVWLDRDRRHLRGLELANGGERWSQLLSGEELPRPLRVLTPHELARPTDALGNIRPGPPGDHRIVLVGHDRLVRVYDSRTGDVLSEGGNVASPGDFLQAYRDRLYVAPEEPGYHLASYSLDDLAATPLVHYRPPETDRFPVALEPCGPDRICLLEAAPFDEDATELVTVPVTEEGQPWRAPAPAGQQVLPVGDWVVVAAGDQFEPRLRAFDESGKQVVDQPGLAVRVNDGNLLMFAAERPSDGVQLAGLAIDRGAPVAIGQLPTDIDAENCVWNDHYLVCPTRGSALIWQFAATG